ncbi:hypothetical protein IFT68_09440 [Oxalobacteraceae sp. CFBP 13730]|nr:hypothetical protein [Oxalobacteraceae sp. CFBP 13730]
MKTTTTAILSASCTLLLSGCATDTPAGTGHTVRNIMASQIIAPQGKRSVPGSDARTAILAYKNYQGSFAAPAPQVEITVFGGKK